MFERLLERLAAALEAAGIPYMVIGGQAVLVHGEPRLTRDIDVTLGVDLDRLGDVLEAVRAASLHPLVDPETYSRQTLVLPCTDAGSGIRVALIFSFSEYALQALARATPVRLESRTVRFAALEDLVVHKIVAGRARDLEDLRGVLRQNPQADLESVRRILGTLAAALGEPLLERFEAVLGSERSP